MGDKSKNHAPQSTADKPTAVRDHRQAPSIKSMPNMPEPAQQNDPTKLSDEQLVELYRNGHEAVFEQLIGRYDRELLNFLIRFLGDRAAAQDVFQETFLQVHLAADQFDSDRRFKPWLFTIAANKGRDFLRRKRRRPAAPLDAPIGSDGKDGQTFIDLLQDDLPLPDTTASSNEIAEIVRAAVDEMPDHLREILLLAYFQKLAYGEIAEVLEIPLGTVKSRLHTAVGTFAKAWKSKNPPQDSA